MMSARRRTISDDMFIECHQEYQNDGDWRISLRQYIFDWSRTGDDANNDPNGLFAALTYRGKHTMDDISYETLDQYLLSC